MKNENLQTQTVRKAFFTRYSLAQRETSGSLLAYGMGPTRLFVQLNGEGVKISLEECKDLFDRYKRTFQTTIGWLEDQKRIARNTLKMQNQVGRMRRWKAPNIEGVKAALYAEYRKKNKGKDPGLTAMKEIAEGANDVLKGAWSAIEREGANFMIQSENVEWTKDSMYEIRKRCKKLQYDARFYNSVYDETVLDVAAKDAEAVHELQKKTMIECGMKYVKQVPVEVEGHLKPYWTK